MPVTASEEVAGDRRLANPALLNQYSRPEVVVRKGPGQPSVTNALPIVFDVVFEEPVVDFPVRFNAPGLQFTGSAAGLHYEVVGEKSFYQVIIRSIEQDGDLTLAIPAALTADLFGNVNRASVDDGARVQYDVTRPRCIIQSDQEGVMNEARMNIALVFSEPVFGLRDDALTLENATVVRTAGQDGDTDYHFSVTPRADGVTALTVPEDAVVDGTGNGNEASPVFSLVVDSHGPEVTLSSFETPQASNSWVIRVHAEFSEPTFDFEREDVAIRGGSLLNFTRREEGMTYVFDVKPTGEEVLLAIPEGVARDAIGNPNAASERFVRQIDRTRPTVTIDVPDTAKDGAGAIAVTVTFSEPVFSLAPDLLQLSRGVAHRVRGEEGDATFHYLVAPTGTGPVELRVASGAARDLAGNANHRRTVRFTPSARRSSPAVEEEVQEAAPPLRPEPPGGR